MINGRLIIKTFDGRTDGRMSVRFFQIFLRKIPGKGGVYSHIPVLCHFRHFRPSTLHVSPQLLLKSVRGVYGHLSQRTRNKFLLNIYIYVKQHGKSHISKNYLIYLIYWIRIPEEKVKLTVHTAPFSQDTRKARIFKRSYLLKIAIK